MRIPPSNGRQYPMPVQIASHGGPTSWVRRSPAYWSRLDVDQFVAAARSRRSAR